MIFKRIAALLSDILGIPASEISPSTRLSKRAGVEPIDVARLVIAVEAEFGIPVHDEFAAFFRTVGDVADYVTRYRAGR